MIIKQFKYGKKLVDFYCYDVVPKDGPFEAVFVLEHYLDLANNFVSENYNVYKDIYSNLTKPKVYLCFNDKMH